MLNLVPVIIETNKAIWNKRHKFNEEIARYEAIVKRLREMNEACFICEGSGKISNGEEWEICPYCHGTGLDRKG